MSGECPLSVSEIPTLNGSTREGEPRQSLAGEPVALAQIIGSSRPRGRHAPHPAGRPESRGGVFAGEKEAEIDNETSSSAYPVDSGRGTELTETSSRLYVCRRRLTSPATSQSWGNRFIRKARSWLARAPGGPSRTESPWAEKVFLCHHGEGATPQFTVIAVGYSRMSDASFGPRAETGERTSLDVANR